jgi:Fe-S cluster biosynthesis and repair protein YggX/rhodanese-related sulfurtransferase
MVLKRVSVDEAKKLLDGEGYVLLDVRSMPEFSAAHPTGAYNVPFLHKTPQGMIPNQDFARIVQFLFPDKNAKIVTSCQMGGRSVRAANELSNLGYQNIVDMRGGFGGERDESGRVINAGWKDSGLPSEEGEPDGRSYKWINNEANKARSPAKAEEHHHEAAAPHGDPSMNRFASGRRKVQCVKLGKELPGLKRRPYPGPLGERIFAEVSAEAWNLWVEHCKMIVNEYRIHAADQSAMKMLMEQCETFLFGDGGAHRPEGYVPEKR